MTGTFNVLAEAAREVRDGDSIVAITTSLVRNAVPGTGSYAATKAAVESLVRLMARELSGRRVRVNAFTAFSPFNRIGRPEESAEVVRFLAYDQASWIEGQIVQPDGGMV